MFLDFLIEYAGEIFIGLIVVLCNLFGKKKTAEQIQVLAKAKKNKAIAKLEKRNAKLIVKNNKECAEAEANQKKIEELKKEE